MESDVDPESNFLYASYLAHCGQPDRALRLLKRAIEGNYCSYPAMDIDNFFDPVRGGSEFAALRAAGKACQQRFLAERHLQQTAK